MSKKIIIDYGSGNVESIKRAFDKIGHNFIISSDKKQIDNATHLVLPGVGAFKNAIEKLKEKKFFELIKKHYTKNKPILGICLGMQLLFSKSYEFGETEGLDIFEGEVKMLKSEDDNSFKVPNIGWFNLIKNNDFNEEKEIKISNNEKFYHVHSFYCEPKNIENMSHYINFGNKRICVILIKNKTIGIQFHPEKSRDDGLKILKFFGNLE